MPNALEVTKDVIEQFIDIQQHMFIAREENAEKTYISLKKRYKMLKAILNAAGVNLTDIDEIKE